MYDVMVAMLCAHYSCISCNHLIDFKTSQSECLIGCKEYLEHCGVCTVFAGIVIPTTNDLATPSENESDVE